jgi:sugar lactone lactonase YvrE
MTDVSVALEAGDQLGEGPFWDERRQALLRVDIANGAVHCWDPATGDGTTRRFDGEVSAVVPRLARHGQVVACGHRLMFDDGTVLAEVERDIATNRFNDCKCDPRGRLWAGTMSTRRTPGAAALYCLTPGRQLKRVISETTISNGLGWSPDGTLMYFIDSTTQRVDVLDFEADTGRVSGRRELVAIDRDDGLPDGLTVDAEGGIWVCLFGGAAVRRYDERGRLDAVVELPVTNPTSPVFGGPRLTTLYVTSARHRLSSEQLAREPLAGAVLALDPGVAGRPGNRFAG